MGETRKPFVRLFFLCTLLGCFWLLPKASPEPQNVQKTMNVPILVTQLQSQNGRPPLEVLCMPAEVISGGDLSGVSCILRNNTTKNINGVSLTYVILIENKDGAIVRDTHSLTMEALIHPDFRETYKAILPGKETSIHSPGFSFREAIPKAIQLDVDYVEFDDGATLGPNLAGSKIIAEMKQGADTYKKWLVKEYIKRGESLSELVSLIQSDEDVPNDIKANGQEEQGARAYRTLMRKQIAVNGSVELKKHFPR